MATKLKSGKWYVVDRFAKTADPVSGPFDTREEAEQDRRELNIADDCEVLRAKQQQSEDRRHEGVECAYCGEVIEEEPDGESTPQGSMHTECAFQHEKENPDEW